MAWGSSETGTAQIAELWRARIHDHGVRLEQVLNDPYVLERALALLTALMSLGDQPTLSENDEESARQIFEPIVTQLRQLQASVQLSRLEMLVLLSTLHDALQSTESPVPDSTRKYRFEQVGALLGRLGIVFFQEESETSSTSSEEIGPWSAAGYAMLYERARKLAITDALTGLANYGYFRDRLRQERARAERYQRLLSLIMFDIDHFKHYNDHNGHPAGNEVLRRIARILAEEAREVDLVARFGGEEFVILATEANRRHALTLAERIRERVAESLLPFRDSQPGGRLTISAGAATFPLDAADEDSLVAAADAALYDAKTGGRNRVCAYSPEMRVALWFRPIEPARSVSIVGSFNNWDAKADAMTPTPAGDYVIELSLEPGTYRYKFVVNSDTWLADPSAEQEADGFGGTNNVLRLRRFTP